MWKIDKIDADSGSHDTRDSHRCNIAALRGAVDLFFGHLAEVEMYRGRCAASVNHQVDR